MRKKMLGGIITKHNKVTMSLVLVANKVINFLFISTVLLSVDEALSVGPLVIQGTALSGVFVAIAAPIFYNLISRGFHSSELTTVNISLLVLYITFIVFVCLGSAIQSDLIPMLILALSLSARGICDSIISVERLVIHRGLVTLLFIEPIRWTIFFISEVMGLYTITLLISMPLLADWLVRVDSLRRIPGNWYAVVLEIFGSLKGDVSVKVAYKAIFVCQAEQLFLFTWAINLSSQESVAYLFSLQVVGLLVLFYLPGWMELLRTSVGLEKSNKAQLMHSHTLLLYRTHLSAGAVLIVTLFVLDFFEVRGSAVWTFIPIGGYAERLGDIDIAMTLIIIFVITCLRSKFMDINLLATNEFYYRKMVVAQAAFLIGSILVFFNLLELGSMEALLGVYACAYIFSVLYQWSKCLAWFPSPRSKKNSN